MKYVFSFEVVSTATTNKPLNISKERLEGAKKDVIKMIDEFFFGYDDVTVENEVNNFKLETIDNTQ